MGQPRGPEENIPLTLFQLLARSEGAVHSRVVDGGGKMAIIEVLEVLAGSIQATRLRIDYRDLNLSPKGQALISFKTGDEDILLLHRPSWKKMSAKNADVFELFHGRRGRIPLPAEGSGIYLEAIKRLGLLTRSDPADQEEGLRKLLPVDNPILREAVLAEIERLAMVSEADLATLVRLLSDPAPGIRQSLLRLIRPLLASIAAESPTEEDKLALEAVRERAYNDSDDNVRSQAVRTMAAWVRREDVVADMRSIADHDASQMVRYEAKRTLFLWKE